MLVIRAHVLYKEKMHGVEDILTASIEKEIRTEEEYLESLTLIYRDLLAMQVTTLISFNIHLSIEFDKEQKNEDA